MAGISWFFRPVQHNKWEFGCLGFTNGSWCKWRFLPPSCLSRGQPGGAGPRAHVTSLVTSDLVQQINQAKKKKKTEKRSYHDGSNSGVWSVAWPRQPPVFQGLSWNADHDAGLFDSITFMPPVGRSLGGVIWCPGSHSKGMPAQAARLSPYSLPLPMSENEKWNQH